jgi:DUF1365 family protein
VHSALYRGQLMHARHDEHARRAFRYPVFMASLDPAELPTLHRTLRLFSHRGRNAFSFDERDYTTELEPLLAANQVPRPHATRVVTNLRVAGYLFNPVTFFLGYDHAGALTSVIAEVNNTYGGNFRYVLGPAERLPDRHGRVGFRHVRELFVSPFLHGPMSYEFWFDTPLDGERCVIAMHVSRVDDPLGASPVFVARFDATRTPLSDRALALAALRYPLMTAQVIGLIHWQAIKLRLAGVPYRRPGPDHRPLAAMPHT